MSIANNQLVTSGNVIEILPTWAQSNTKPSLYIQDLISNSNTSPASSSSGNIFLGKGDYFKVLYSSSSKTVYLPSSPSSGETHFIVSVGGGLSITGNGKTCYYGGTSKGTGTWTLTSYHCLAICFFDGVQWRIFALQPR